MYINYSIFNFKIQHQVSQLRLRFPQEVISLEPFDSVYASSLKASKTWQIKEILREKNFKDRIINIS